MGQPPLPCPDLPCLSFRASAEESQPHGATILAMHRPPLSVIPSVSRGIPTAWSNHHCQAQAPLSVIPSVSRGIPTAWSNHHCQAQAPLSVIPSDSRGIPTKRGNHHSHAQTPLSVIPSDSRGIPTAWGNHHCQAQAPLVCHSERQSRNPNRMGEPSLPRTDLPCLSFRASVEESQPHGATTIAMHRPPLSVIPSDSRGIPTAWGNHHCHAQALLPMS